jgi:regulator of sigma E protease
MPAAGYKGFGILHPISTEIAKVRQPDELYVKTGLKPGDVLTAIDGERIEEYWQFGEKLKESFAPSVSLTFRRPGQTEAVVKEFKIEFTSALGYEEGGDFFPAHIYGLIPRLKISTVNLSGANEALQTGDIIVRAADTANPTYGELREITTAHANKELGMTVLRNDELVETTIVPKKGTDGRIVIGIGVGLDMEHSVVAAVADVNMFALPDLLKIAEQWLGGTVEPVDLPRGSQIISIAGKDVENYFDIAVALETEKGETVKITYRSALDTDQLNFAVPDKENTPATQAILMRDLPFKQLTRLYRAAGMLDAVAMGTEKTVEFVMQTYMTLKGLIVGSVSPKSLMGPVGMIAASSKIISEKDFIQYLHFMGIIGACLAVMNFLPLPILDGGLIVLLIIEKIKGSPVHIKVQEGLTYAGLAIIGALFVMITYNDIIRVFFNK